MKGADFGVAKGRTASNATASCIAKGKPGYMSPEQVNGQPLDGRSDLFAVGVMLWQMLCLQPLFRSATVQETVARLLGAPIAPPCEVRSGVPEDLSHVVMRLLARDRDRRTPDAGSAITELIACAEHPRNGRELLVQVLAERFGRRDQGAAPVRSHAAAGGPFDAHRASVGGSRRGRAGRATPVARLDVLASCAVAGCLIGAGLCRRAERARWPGQRGAHGGSCGRRCAGDAWRDVLAAAERSASPRAQSCRRRSPWDSRGPARPIAAMVWRTARAGGRRGARSIAGRAWV